MSTKLAKVIAKYISLRDERDAVKAKHSQEIRERFTDPMNKIEAALLKHFDKTEQLNSKTENGTAYISHRVTDKVADRAAFLDFVMNSEEDHTALIESRIATKALDEFIKEHDDLPPGVIRRVERKINIRR